MTSPITTHILDTSRGRPAGGVTVVLERMIGAGYERVGVGITDEDGRLRTLLGPGALEKGVYRLAFDTGAYFANLGVEGFYPEVTIAFEVRSPHEHHHVPLLLNPYGYSTYRGS
jgi:5-hydroxyisourate hydrolase